MTRHGSQLGVVALLLGLTGCQGMFAARGLPDDPLFLEKKPLEAKAVQAPPVPLAYAEPAPPSNPYFPHDRADLARGPARKAHVPGTLTDRPSGDQRDE